MRKFKNKKTEEIKEIGYHAVSSGRRTYEVWGWWDKKRKLIAVNRKGEREIFAMKKPIQYEGITDFRFHRIEND